MSTFKNKKRQKGDDDMKEGTLAIYDLDGDYANCLIEYISDKQRMPFSAIAFTKKSELLNYAMDNYIDILLISAVSMEPDIGELDIGKIILLSSGNVLSEYIGYSSIYKYQSTENIIREVLNYFVDVHQEGGMVAVSKGDTEIIGVFSPLGRTGKTTFALTLGQVLSSEYSVLYINMEEFSAFDKILEKEYSGDLADLMYFYKQNPEVMTIKLQTIVKRIHGMDYVPPLLFSEDLRNIESKEWINLIEKIARTDVYDKIVLDLSNMVKNVFEVLDICDLIYMPIDDDRMSLMKISAYEEYLLKTEREDIMNRTVKIKVPKVDVGKWDDNYLEQQLWGPLGDFIRKMLREGAA